MLRKSPPKALHPLRMLPVFRVKLTGKSLLLGRNECCDTVLPLDTVSKHHCRFYRHGQRWFVEDLDSRNGTFVNQERVRRKRIRVGDVVSVGDFTFVVK